MGRYLIFQLYGPLVAWGGTAVGEVRPTLLKPTRSAILGLLAAGIGLQREDEPSHERLGEEILVGIKVLSTGLPLTDFHTVQALPRRAHQVEATRGDQLRGVRDDWDTIVSTRDYRCDALCQVAVWPARDESGMAYPLVRLAEALEEPHFVLYLGRKSCPPALPLRPRIVEAASLHHAFSQVEAPVIDGLAAGWRRTGAGTERLLFWEGDPDAGGVPVIEIREQRDDPASRLRWSFRRRREFMGVSSTPEEES